MGYCARDGSGDGKTHYMPRVTSLDHVADANARLSLTETVTTHQPITAGYQVVQDSNGLTYTYSGPSSALTACFVTGFGDGVSDGIYTKREVINGRDQYNQLRQDTDAASSSILWTGTQWNIYAVASLELLAHSTANVTFPWQVSEWVIDGDVGAPTVTSLTKGEVDAGATVAEAGTIAVNGIYPNTGSLAVFVGRWEYAGPISHFDHEIHVSDTQFYWAIFSEGLYNDITSGSLAFPWQITVWDRASGDAPVPTVTRNDIASEANWSH